ncbi:phage holin family protein [Lacihabitans sp. CS3-21]|jgi:putative membrane protein|uniref:phage holin family protein n=1 Tax=Lacihabitans sp. CS3-21 TaxID=2487332 RepID=UPI0020CC4399|nr:phage holin family protein [Lacihabitans sp. CS3-21]MCP9747545.1 phage holin family protein [Lacihabitans sp. CS3-21]
MTNYIVRLLVCGLILFLVPNYLKGVQVDGYVTAIIVALVMSILNTFVRPILSLISLPITFLTLGLFSLVISVCMVYLCDYLVDGFSVEGFLPPLILSFILSIANGIVGMFQKDK